MISNDLVNQMTVANGLLDTFQGARDKNLKFAFSANIWVLALAGAAGSAVAFHANKATLAGIGVGAGTLLAGNTFVNARANARVYQSGMNALTCEVVNLKPFSSNDKLPTDSVAGDLAQAQSAIDQATQTVATLDLDKDALSKAQAALTAINKGKPRPATPAPAASTVDNAALTDAIGSLKSAVADAKKAQVSLTNVTTLLAQLPLFAANATASIDQAVAAKISQTDVPYTSTVASITPLTTAPTASKPLNQDLVLKEKSIIGQPPQKPLTPLQAATEAVTNAASKVAGDVANLSDLQKEMITLAATIETDTAKLNADVTNYGLSTAESNVTACIKAI